ncbi:Maltase 1 [Camponotus floridanus]|uniref:alpha-glucosidase n=1 Tax=Camponotus floridanus TaxID=104421 RepID=E2AHZ9_CAMFO|nr:Maltase 1 [Camponotus floridanus]
MESGRDGGEVNGDVKETPSSVVKNSKSEEPRDERQQQHVTNMGKQNDEDLDEGAQERMLQGDDGNAKITEKDNIEVKFISENGDVKIDIEPSKDTLVGMSKEELMKFANDPFWVRLRWALFIFFWLLWIGMLAGAIAIVVIAPKCAAPEPKKFWEESPIIQLDIIDSPTNDLKGLELVLSDLKDRHIKAISLSSIVKEDADGTTEDFKALESKLGNISDLENLIKAATEKDQQIFLELDPNHSSVEHPWFKRSVEKEDPYTSYYVWADGGKERQNPPNNWLNVYGESAWEWNEQRGQYYLHQFNKSQPDLNYNNPAMVKEFGDILIHWLKLGISGFRLANTSFLTEDPDLRDEHPSLLPVERNNYQSLVHVYTRNRPENVAILTKWQEIVRNETDGKGLFALQDDISADILQVYNEKKAIIDLPQSSHFLTTANASINATVLRRSISQWLRITSWPAWDLNGKQQSLKHRMPNVADSFTLMTMLLPGTPILRLDDVMSLKDTFATLSNARRGLTFLHGSTTFRVINETVFVYARVRSGNPGYLVAYQTGNESAIIDLSEIPQISEEITVVACSPNYIRDPEVR